MYGTHSQPAGTVRVSKFRITKKNYLSTGPVNNEIGANEASAQGLQNSLKNECSANFFAIWHPEIASLYGDCMEQAV